MSIDVKYRTAATAAEVAMKELGPRTVSSICNLPYQRDRRPRGDGVNPEQLFAAGYAACFLSSVKGAGQKLKVRVSPEATVKATVGIGMNPEGGYGLAIELAIRLPAVDPVQAQQVIDLAHQICPYSNATRNNVDVRLSLV